MSDFHVSIIVPLRHDPFPAELVHACLSQTWIKEIILVDTSPSLSPYENKDPRVKSLHMPELNTRAQAMNHGGNLADVQSNYLWFLHSDMRISPKLLLRLQAEMGKRYRALAFLKFYHPTHFFLNVQNRFLNMMLKRFKRMGVGTNGLLIDKNFWTQLGKFPPIPFLEDVVLFDILRGQKALYIIPESIEVSSRKYACLKGLPRMMRNLAIYLLYRLGVSPQSLARYY